MQDIASFRIYDSRLHVSTVVNPPPSDKRVASWGPGFRSPDWETFNRLLDVLRAKGFSIGGDPWTDRSFKSLSRYHRMVEVGTPHGTLYAHCEASTNGCIFEFFQEVVTVNRCGGRFDFDKRAKMPYLIGKKFEGALAALTAHLRGRGFVEKTEIDAPVRLMPIHHRLNVAEGTALPLSDAERAAAALAAFDDKWDGEYDRKRGTHRFRRDETGWPTDDELGAYNRKDADGAVLGQGDVRLIRDHRGYLKRGRVYGGINGRWNFVYGPGPRDNTHVSSYELFSGDPRTMKRRLKKARPLDKVLEEAVGKQDFRRAAALCDLIARKRSAEKTTAKAA